jgi:hypothetical protein
MVLRRARSRSHGEIAGGESSGCYHRADDGDGCEGQIAEREPFGQGHGVAEVSVERRQVAHESEAVDDRTESVHEERRNRDC